VFNVSNIILEEDLLHVDYPVGDAEIKVVQQSIEEIKRKILEVKHDNCQKIPLGILYHI